MTFVTIDNVSKTAMSSIYCKCGNIVSIDRNSVRLKKSLHKNVECPICRNFRISNDIDYINCIFDGSLDEESMA